MDQSELNWIVNDISKGSDGYVFTLNNLSESKPIRSIKIRLMDVPTVLEQGKRVGINVKLQIVATVLDLEEDSTSKK